MSLSWSDFVAQRAGKPVQYFSCPGATQTVMVCSHIWWTDQIALAVLNAGYNLLVHFPFYLLYVDAAAAGRFDELWTQILAGIREAKVDVILGGNSAAMLVHPKSGEMIQDAASSAEQRPVKLVNWWWDEVRAKPPLAQGGSAPADFLRLLGNARTINAIWDLDVKEELEASYGLKNLMHLPLATLPEFWPRNYLPLEDRPLAACFLGNCHFTPDWAETDTNPLTLWARQIVQYKIADPRRSMQACIEEVTRLTGGIPLDPRQHADDAWGAFAWPSEILNAVYMQYTRNRLVVAAANHLKGKLALVGKGWDKLGLRDMEHAFEKSGMIYAQSRISLNLFGGCVHGGLPLRPYDIGASGGLIVTHDQRELPSLFEPGKECVVFRGQEEMLAKFEQIRAAPAPFNAIALAGRRRVLAEHTWGHRVKRLMERIWT